MPSLERYDPRYRGYSYPLVALGGQYLPAGLDDLGEAAGFHHAGFYACGLCLGGRHDNFVRGAFGVGGFGVCVAFVVVIVAFFFQRMLFVVMGFGGMVVFIVSVVGPTVAGAQRPCDEDSQ